MGLLGIFGGRHRKLSVHEKKLVGEKVKQRGHSHIHADRMRPALKSGWRVSAKGKLYFENRANRSDKHHGKKAAGKWV